MSTDHGFVIYHHWSVRSVLSCKITIRLPLVLPSSAPLSVYHRAKCPTQKYQSVSVLNLLRTLIQLQRKQFVSTVSSGSDLWEFHTFAFVLSLVSFVLFLPLCPTASPWRASHTRTHRPLSFLPLLTLPLTPVLSCRFREWLCRAQTMLTRINCQLRQFHLNRRESKPWISHETNSNFACWMGLSEVDVLSGLPSHYRHRI